MIDHCPICFKPLSFDTPNGQLECINREFWHQFWIDDYRGDNSNLVIFVQMNYPLIENGVYKHDLQGDDWWYVINYPNKTGDKITFEFYSEVEIYHSGGARERTDYNCEFSSIDDLVKFVRTFQNDDNEEIVFL